MTNTDGIYNGSHPIQIDKITAGEDGSADRSWHSEEKKHRKWERNYWASSIILTTVVSVGAGLSAYFSYKAATETRRQADIAHDAMIAQFRPWIKISFLNGQLHWDGQGSFYARIRLNQVNFGGGPAVTYDVAMDITGPGNEPTHTSQVVAIREFCVKSQPNVEDTRSVMFKDANRSNEVAVVKSTDQDASWGVKKQSSPQLGDTTVTEVYAIACVSYKTPGDDVWHHTGLYAHLTVWDYQSNKPISAFSRPMFSPTMVPIVVDDYAD